MDAASTSNGAQMYLELTLDRPQNGPQKDYGTTNRPTALERTQNGPKIDLKQSEHKQTQNGPFNMVMSPKIIHDETPKKYP